MQNRYKYSSPCTTYSTETRQKMDFCPICLWQNGLMPQKANWRKIFNAFSTIWKPDLNGRLLPHFHDAVFVGREQQAPQPLALAVASVHAFRRRCHACLYGTIVFCPVFSKNFNIMSTLFVHQPLTLSQKIDSREGLFWCKRGLASECGKMNINSKRPPLAPLLGLFGAKYSAICC